MAFLSAIILLAGFTVIVWQYWERLMGDDDSARGQRWFWKWYIKGVAAPVVIWVLLGAGAMPGLPSLFGLPALSGHAPGSDGAHSPQPASCHDRGTSRASQAPHHPAAEIKQRVSHCRACHYE